MTAALPTRTAPRRRRLGYAFAEILRLAGWGLWAWATFRAPYGHELFGVGTVDDAMATFSTLIPLVPLLFLLLVHDLARRIHRARARRRLGREAYARFVAELGREPDVPGLFPWSVRLALILLPFALDGALRALAPAADGGIPLWTFYAGALSLWLLVADVRAAARYRA